MEGYRKMPVFQYNQEQKAATKTLKETGEKFAKNRSEKSDKDAERKKRKRR